MKKITLYLISALILWSFIPITATAKNLPEVPKEIQTIESSEASILIGRLEEIKATDKSSMNSSEKRALRKEVRSIKKTLTEMRGGVYLSVGAIIIIILLLILLL